MAVNTVVFDYPWNLLGFAVFVPLIFMNLSSARLKRIHNSLPKNLRRKLFASRAFFALFLACSIIALAGPSWGIGFAADEYRRAVDVVIALDVSRSMDIMDCTPGRMVDSDQTGEISRLERGLTIAREAVSALPGMRFAATVSRNRGIVAIPLTWNNGALLAFLEAIDGSSLTGWGTNLESLVDTAASAFQASQPSARVILLVSDGEALSGSLNAAIGRCSREGIIVTSIAVGSDEGRQLPGNDTIISRRDSAALRMAAGDTGGAFIDGNRSDAAEALIAHLRSLAAESKTGGSRKERQARWHIFAILAIITFGASRASLLKLGKRRYG
jgi:Ca-activated chloride channel family protein